MHKNGTGSLHFGGFKLQWADYNASFYHASVQKMDVTKIFINSFFGRGKERGVYDTHRWGTPTNTRKAN